MRKVKLKLKQGVINKLKIIGVVIVILLIAYGIYNKQITNLTELGYSREASKKILFHKEKEYIISIKENKTLNAALESDYYKEKYLKDYAKITYCDHANLVKNINKLLDKGYSNSDVSIILTHGDDSDVSEFAKRDRVKYLE
jgi:DNA-binding MarR family transcriptional regulator